MLKFSSIFLSLFLFSFQILASHPIVEIQKQLQTELTDVLQNNGSDAVAVFVRERMPAFREGITFGDLKKMIHTLHSGQPMMIEVDLPDTQIKSANLRLKRSGVDFIQFHKNDWGISNYEPVKENDKRIYKKIMATRMVISPLVALAGGIAGGVMSFHQSGSPDAEFWTRMTPAIAQSVTAFGLEAQFTLFSRQWAKFWNRTGFAGNVAINYSYAAILALVAYQATSMVGMTSEFSVKDFLAQTTFNAVTFVASFGAAQIALAKLQAKGSISELKRFAVESVSVLWNNLGRVISLVAASKVAGAEDITSWIGYGIQAFYFSVATIPLWTKLIWADRHFDRNTKDEIALSGTGQCRGLLSRVAAKFQ